MSNSTESNEINWDRLFNPRAIGIIGTNYDPAGGTYFLLAMRNKFRGPMYLFNPRLAGQELFGYKVYGSVLDLPEDKPIDYVIMGVPARLCPKLMEEVGKKGIPFATVFSSGFGEIGEDKLADELMEIAKKYNVRVIGPNCIGVYTPKAGLYFGSGQSKKSGNFSATFQSGGLAVNTASLAVSYGCYVSKMISIGNAMDLSHPDFMEYFLKDENTAIIGLYLEHLRNAEEGRRFMEIAKKCNLNRKPVILWKAGYGEATRKAIFSHTGGLAGNNKIWKAVAKQTGCCLVYNSVELTALASAFKNIRLPASRNIGLIGIGGGSTIEAGDALEKHGLKIPRLTDKTISKMGRFLPDVNTSFTNPLDLGASGAMPHIYSRVIKLLDRDPNIDAIVFVKDPERFSGLEDRLMGNVGFSKGMNLSKAFIKYIGKLKRTNTKPMICVMLKISEGFEEYKSRYNFKFKLLNRGVPVFESVDLAGLVLDHMNNYREFLQKHGKYPKT